MIPKHLPIALVGGSTAEVHIPIELVDLVGSLTINGDLADETSIQVVALAPLLSSCPNISYLDIVGHSILGLADRLSHPLLNVRTVFINVSPYHPPAEVASLLDLMPNMRRVLLLPGTQSPILEDSLPQKRRLDDLTLMGVHMALLPLITSKRWTVRVLTLWFSLESSVHLESIAWPPAGSLPRIEVLRVILRPLSDPAHATRFVASCSVLRRLEIYTDPHGLETATLLPDLLPHCHRLSALVFQFPSSTTSASLLAASRLLAEAFPRTLRALSLTVRRRSDWTVFDDIKQLCRARRVRFSIESF
ncbi:hypothetical protein AURDEDRAFT_166239 [Auricularia subglabra TFB-10046 SS5]|nr:hypothetical protein AURDEDRAFT_166239 [Auricularia subglabra TFB-10046 SS5]